MDSDEKTPDLTPLNSVDDDSNTTVTDLNAPNESVDLPADIVEIIELQQTLMGLQMAAFEKAKKRQSALKTRMEDPQVLANRTQRGGIADPTKDEVALMTLLDSRGVIRRLSFVEPFLELMKSSSSPSNKDCIERSTFVAILRRSDENIWDQFVLLNGLDIIKLWLSEAISIEDYTTCQLILKFLAEAPPVCDQQYIKKCGLGKEVGKLRRLGGSSANGDDTTPSLSTSALAAKEGAERVGMIWRLMIRGATDLPKVALPPASLSATKRESSSSSSSLSSKRNLVDEEISRKQLLKSSSADRAEAARLLREQRIEKAKRLKKGESLLQQLPSSSSSSIPVLMSKRSREGNDQKQDRLRKLRMEKQASLRKSGGSSIGFKSRVFDNDITSSQLSVPDMKRSLSAQSDNDASGRQDGENNDDERSYTKLYGAKDNTIQTPDTQQVVSETVGGGFDEEPYDVFESLSKLDEERTMNDGEEGFNDISSSSSQRRIKWGDEVEGSELHYIKEFVTDLGEGVVVQIEEGEGYRARTKLEHEKEKESLEEVKALQKADELELRQEAWDNIQIMIDQLSKKLSLKLKTNKLKDENMMVDDNKEEEDIPLLDMIQATYEKPHVRVLVDDENPLLVGDEELSSMELQVQNHRNAQLIEVFSTFEIGSEPPEEDNNMKKTDKEEAEKVPLHNVLDIQKVLRPNLTELEDGSFDMETNLKLGSLSENKESLKQAREMIRNINDIQLEELKLLFPEINFPELWTPEEEVSDLPAELQDLSQDMMSYLAEHDEVLTRFFDQTTLTVDKVKLDAWKLEYERMTNHGGAYSNAFPQSHGQSSGAYPDQSSTYTPPSVTARYGSGGGGNMGGSGNGPMGGNMGGGPMNGGGGGSGGSGGGSRVAAVRVEFKRGRIEAFRVDDPELAVKCASFNGPYHMWVECDPGEDVGRVIHQMGHQTAGDTFSLKRALRVASEKDVRGFVPKASAEKSALDMARNLATDMRLPMIVDDTEWQFDKKKLTLFYTPQTRERVDFREFVKKIGGHFKTFLWMTRSDGKAPPPASGQASTGFGDTRGGKGGFGGGGKGGKGQMMGNMNMPQYGMGGGHYGPR